MKLPAIALGCLILSAATPLSAQDSTAGIDAAPAELARYLDGREAGEPQRCIRPHGLKNVRIIDGTGIVYDFGSTVYLNVPTHPEMLDDRDRLLVKRYSSSICNSDKVTTEDRSSGVYTGNVFLGDFVPYRRVTDAG